MKSTFKMIVLMVFSAFIFAETAFAQDKQELENGILRALLQPLPITVVGPIVAPQQQISEQQDNGSYRIDLPGAKLLGFLPIENLSLSLKKRTDGDWDVIGMTLPEQTGFPGIGEIGIGDTQISGIWSFETNTYKSLNLTLVQPTLKLSNPDIVIKMSALDIKIDQQGVTSDQTQILATGSNVKGLLFAGTDDSKDFTTDNLTLSFAITGEEPIDVATFFTTYITYMIMDPASSRAERLKATLPTEIIEDLTVEVSFENLSFLREGLSEKVAEKLKITELAKFKSGSFKLAGRDINPTNLGGLSATLALNEGHFATLDFEPKLVTMSSGATTYGISDVNLANIKSLAPNFPALGDLMAGRRATFPSELALDVLLDTFLGFGEIYWTVDYRNVEFSPTVGRYSSDFGFVSDKVSSKISLSDFNKQEGKISLSLQSSGNSMTPYEVKRITTKFIDGRETQVTLSDEEYAKQVEARDQRLNEFEIGVPKTLNVSTVLTNFSDELIHKIASDLVLSGDPETDGIALASLVGILPTLEIKSEGEFLYETEVFSVLGEGNTTIVPLRWLGSRTSPAESTIRIKNFDGLKQALLNAIDSSSEVAPLLSIFAILNGYATKDGNDRIFEFQAGDGDDFVTLNDRRLYLLNLAPFFSLAAIGGL